MVKPTVKNAQIELRTNKGDMAETAKRRVSVWVYEWHPSLRKADLLKIR